QRDRYFRKGAFFAADVIGINANIRCVAHLPGGSNVAHHPLFSDLQPMSLTVHGATMHAGDDQFSPLLIVPESVGLQAAKRGRYVIDNLIDELIEVEDRSDLLGCLFQLQQVLHLVNWQWPGGWVNGSGGSGACCHLLGPPRNRRMQEERALALVGLMRRRQITTLFSAVAKCV